MTVAEFEAHKDAYEAQRKWWKPKATLPRDSAAKVVLISGCQDDQTSMDGPVNGAFTGAFLQVWDNGSYQRNYSDLKDAVVAQIASPDQTPGIFFYGVDVLNMLPQVPLGDDKA